MTYTLVRVLTNIDELQQLVFYIEDPITSILPPTILCKPQYIHRSMTLIIRKKEGKEGREGESEGEREGGKEGE